MFQLDKLKIIIGIGIIIASFIYIMKNKGSMLDNMLRKTKEEYEKQQAIKEKAREVADGQADAFDSIAGGVRNAAGSVKEEVDRKLGKTEK